MSLRVVSIALGVVAAAPVPAHGQASAPAVRMDAAIDKRHQGYRLAQTADGFQLVEHGVWEEPSAGAVQESGQTPVTSAPKEPTGWPAEKQRGSPGRTAFVAQHTFPMSTLLKPNTVCPRDCWTR